MQILIFIVSAIVTAFVGGHIKAVIAGLIG